MKLHLGAYDQAIDGWVNTDITPHIWISRVPFLPLFLYKLNVITSERYRQHKRKVFSKLKYLDLARPLPFVSGSVEAIFSSHVLEHLFMDEVERLIHEMYRVLKPGGVCRVVVPDLEKIVALYDPDDPRDFLEGIFEISKRGAVKNQHHCGFTGRFLIRLFSEANFSQCAIEQYKTGRCPDIEQLDNRPESLFFEATK